MKHKAAKPCSIVNGTCLLSGHFESRTTQPVLSPIPQPTPSPAYHHTTW
jgi:hypothetical protein